MSTRAKVCGWVAAFVVLGGWSWHQATFNGFQLAVCLGCIVAGFTVRGIDSQRPSTGPLDARGDDIDRAANPRPYNGERP